MTTPEKPEKEINGGRNLCILGIAAALIALVTTAVSLKIYHDTGDVYLDRSRPGYIEEEDDDTTEHVDIETFSDSGTLDDGDINWYLNQLQLAKDALNNSAGFSVDAISDEALDLVEETSSESVSATGEDLTDPGVSVATGDHHD